MQAQELTLEELRQLYQSRISRDFVPNELRPWGNMRALALRGAYRAFAYREKGAVLAYGIFAHCPGAALLDYLAVDPALRGRGLGTRFFQALQGAARQLGASFFLIEAESLESAQTPAEKEVRRRRIQFYTRCGCRETGLFSFLFGVEYQILLFPLEREPGREQARAALESLYRLLFRVSAGASKRAPRSVCRIYEKGGTPGENRGFYMDLL